MSNRETDINGYVTIKKNPISKVGVFPYMGKNIDAALEPNKIYWVYRPAEELCKPETIESFKHIPIIDDHAMLGKGQTPAERKGVDGVTGGNVIQEGEYLYADLHIYSDTLKRKIDQGGKKDLSIGYRVGRWEPANGLFNGQPYDFIQRDLLGNHVAVVTEGRSGKDVSVLDHTITYDHMDIAEDGKFDDNRIKRLEQQLDKYKSRVNFEDDNDRRDNEKLIKTTEAAIKQAKDTASDSTASPAAENTGDADQHKKGANDMADEDKKKDEDKMAKDKKAMDADTKEKEGDEKLAKDKKAMDAEEEEEKKKKAEDKKAMDKKAMDKDEEEKKDKKETMDSLSELRSEIADLKKNGIKALMGELNRRNEVAKTVEAQFGTFDHAELTTAEVAQYGLKKAGISAPAGAEIAVWDAYCGGRKVNARPAGQAMDSQEQHVPVGSLIEKTLKASK